MNGVAIASAQTPRRSLLTLSGRIGEEPLEMLDQIMVGHFAAVAHHKGVDLLQGQLLRFGHFGGQQQQEQRKTKADTTQIKRTEGGENVNTKNELFWFWSDDECCVAAFARVSCGVDAPKRAIEMRSPFEYEKREVEYA